MKRIANITLFVLLGLGLLLIFIGVSGCGAIEIYTPDGKLVAREVSLLKGVQFQRFATTAPAGMTSIEGGAASVDNAAIQAITDGVVAGVVKGLVKP